MKTKFQQYNSKSDEELIELSMGNSVDASMAHAVLDYRKYVALKNQNKLSFFLAIIVAFFALIQVSIAVLNFQNPMGAVQIENPTESSSPTLAPTATNTSISIASPTQQPPPSPTLPYVGTAILQFDVTVAATDDNGVEILITLTAGTRVTVLSKDTKLERCNALIDVRYKTDYGSIEVTESIPLALIGETC